MAKVAVLCESPLLKKAVERFVGSRLAPFSQCDLAIGDRDKDCGKPLLIIGEHIHKPFCKERLNEAIDRFNILSEVKAASIGLFDESPKRGDIDEKIADLTDRYAKELLEILRQK